MDYKYHLERILDRSQTVQEQVAAMTRARKELFLEKNQKTMKHLQENAHEYTSMSKIECMKQIREQYGFSLPDAVAIIEKLGWFE